jgi:hypothetical protein
MKTQNVVQALNNLRSELERLRDEERRYEDVRTAVPNNGIVVLILVQSKKLDNNQGSIRSILEEINSKFGGTVPLSTVKNSKSVSKSTD